MSNEAVRQALGRVFAANQTNAPPTESGTADLVAALRLLQDGLEELRANIKGGRITDAVLNDALLAVLTNAVISPHSSPEFVWPASTVSLSEQLVECLLAMVASEHRLAQKKALKLIAATERRPVKTLMVAKGAIEVITRCVCATPLLLCNRVRVVWACAALASFGWYNSEHAQLIATSNNVLSRMIDILRVRSEMYDNAKFGVSNCVWHLSLSPEGALVLVAHKLVPVIGLLLDSAPQSPNILGLQFDVLVRMLKQDIALYELVREQSVAVLWRYLLYHAKHTSRPSTDKYRRQVLVKAYAEAMTLQRHKVKLLWKSTTHGDNERKSLDALLALVFMSPTKDEKKEFLLDGGIDVLLRGLKDHDTLLNTLTALNCLALGDGQIYDQCMPTPDFTPLPPPTLPAALPLPTTASSGLRFNVAPQAPPAAQAADVDPPIPRPVRRTVTQLACFAQWRQDQALHDVAFSFPDEKNKTMTAHKLVLAARSAVFKAMFTSGMLEDQRIGCGSGLVPIAIPNMSSATFGLLLDFSYGVHLLDAASQPQPTHQTTNGGGAGPEGSIVASLRAITSWLHRAEAGVDQVAALLAAAGQYEMLDLEDACAHFLGSTETLTSLNVVDLLELGLGHRSPILIFRCFELVLADPTTSVLFKRFEEWSHTAVERKTAAKEERGIGKDLAEEKEEEGDEDEDELEVDEEEEEERYEGEPLMHKKPKWLWKRKAREVFLAAECHQWLRDFVVRGMLDVPQLVVTVENQQLGLGVVNAKDSKNYCLSQ